MYIMIMERDKEGISIYNWIIMYNIYLEFIRKSFYSIV